MRPVAQWRHGEGGALQRDERAHFFGVRGIGEGFEQPELLAM